MMRFFSIIFLLLLLPAVLGATAEGAVIIVPDDQPTIQDAIAAAATGDLVIVRPGTYRENIDFLGKMIVVRSAFGPEVTIIDGGKAGSTVVFGSGEGPDSVLDGFTITNGQDSEGGGIRLSSSEATIRGNIIRGNSASMGGGIYCTQAPTITGNVISGNTAASGGGIFANSNVTAKPLIAGNRITGNRAGNGGGIYVLDKSQPEIENDIIASNTADVGGGGIYFYQRYQGTVKSCTIVDNEANYFGGGIYLNNNSNMAVVNTILYGDDAPEGPEIWIGYDKYPSSLSISYSDVMGGKASVWLDSGCILDWGAGMIAAAPLMASWGSGDYHLTFPSPCRDSGNGNPPGLPAEDFEGDPRIAGAETDMGADEFHTHLYHLGAVMPGVPVELRVVQAPGTAPVWIAAGSGLRGTPYPTPYGDLYLLGPIMRFNAGSLPGSGILAVSRIVPSGWTTGRNVALQALAGTELTNADVLVVE